jgi:hypothetical protein
VAEIKMCEECGVPVPITGNYLWLNSGVMVQRDDQTRRLGFLESENLDPLYKGIENVIGIPIDRQVIDIVRKGTVNYFGSLIPREARGIMLNSESGLDAVIDFMVTMAQINGFGKYEVLDMRYEGKPGDHTLTRITQPFSVLLCAGIQAGGCEVVSNNPHTASYEEVSPEIYEMDAYISEHAGEMEKRLQLKEYRHREGDIDLEKCPTCGGPKALSGLKWFMDRGMIINTFTHRRMAMIGPEIQDPLFEELQKELGDAIPQAVIEAQRRFVKTGFYSIDEVSNEGDFRTQLALRGMGNLREIRIGANGMCMRVDNAADYLMAVGLAQGLFEMAFDVDSNVEWELSEEGDLEVEVTPKSIMESVST